MRDEHRMRQVLRYLLHRDGRAEASFVEAHIFTFRELENSRMITRRGHLRYEVEALGLIQLGPICLSP